MNKQQITLGVVIACILIFLLAGTRMFVSVDAGHVGVATLFGSVREKPYAEGLHVPINPLYKWEFYDIREKEHQEKAGVPSQDQLTTQVDVSIKWRINAADAPRILQETGTFQDAISVHIKPALRSVLREQGKSIKRAEDFFLRETQEQLQDGILETMRAKMGPKGIICENILIRDISLPPFIVKAIEEKKEREQEVEKQKAELERFRTEQQEKIAQAEAERTAAEQEALQRRLLADAQAYEIEKLNEAIANNPAYIQLEALKALAEISKDPAAKIYFINSDSPMPLPLMNMGDPLNSKP